MKRTNTMDLDRKAGIKENLVAEVGRQEAEAIWKRAKEILIRRFGGYTIQEAHGGWIGDDGKEYQEYTLVIYLSDTTADQVHTAANELIDVFHQSSVMIQANPTKTEFYSGN